MKSNGILPRVGVACSMLIVAAFSVLVTACTSPLSSKEALSINGNTGLVAFDFNTSVEGDFQIRLGGLFGKMLTMNNVPAGESIYLYKMKPGKYCISSIYMTGSDEYLHSSEPPCFMVNAGILTYAGTLTNSLYNTYTVDYQGFLKALKSVYPMVYARYVTNSGSVNQPHS